MSESIEYYIEHINQNIKSESENIQEYVKEISNPENKENHIKLGNSCEGINHSLKIIKRSKMLKNKYKRIQSKINELSHYVYKPEEIESDDELKWEREEMSRKTYTIGPNDTIEIKSENESESKSESESESESETESEKLINESFKNALINSQKHIIPKVIEKLNKSNCKSKSI